jgi:hypothetical protein
MTAKSNKTQSEQPATAEEKTAQAQEHFAEQEAAYQESLKALPKITKFSINWFVVAPTGEHFQPAIEGPTFLGVMEEVSAAMEWFAAAGFVPKAVGGATNTLPANTASRATQPVPQPVPQDAAPRASGWAYVPDQQDFGAGVQAYNAVMTRIQPVAGNKVKIEFFGNDLKQPVNQWPSFKFQGDIAKGADLLTNTGLVASDLLIPQDLAVNWTVYWKQGREYTKRDGSIGHYNDVIEVREA